ncbi:hypothetical protein JXB28_00845 [Candidatus Woesearchaeota archaeon]|nr:hypothetical protein [Candidatus Woesearchaeota archaeon]
MRLSKDKKGVEITLQTVIIAVLVLIVLVVLLYILFKGIGGFGEGATGCVDRGGECVSDAESCRQSGGSVYSMGSCPQGMKCCMYPKNLFQDDQNEYQ